MRARHRRAAAAPARCLAHAGARASPPTHTAHPPRPPPSPSPPPPGGQPDLLPDLRPLPAKLPGTSTLKAEGATYNWLWGAIRNLAAFTPCSKTAAPHGGALDLMAPSGWEGVGGTLPGAAPGVVNLEQGAVGGSLPFMAILRKKGAAKPGSLAIVIRGTLTPFEWRQGARARRGAARRALLAPRAAAGAAARTAASAGRRRAGF